MDGLYARNPARVHSRGIQWLIFMPTTKTRGASSVPEECPLCGSVGTVAVYRGPFKASYNRIHVELTDIERCVCQECDERFFTKLQSRDLSRKVKEAARESVGALEPGRISSIRKRLGLSQEELEDLLGLGPKVVTRWENGKVIPGRATDYLLRLLERMPEIIGVLKAIRNEIGRAPSESLD